MRKSKISLDVPQARRILLTQAIEEADKQNATVSPDETAHIDKSVFEPARAKVAAGQQVETADVLDRRAKRVLEVVARGNAPLAAMQHAPVGQGWFAFGAPIVALVLGVATDRIANPHRVDLLSLPLLLILLWNAVIYAALLVLSLRRDGRPAASPFPALRRAFAKRDVRNGRVARAFFDSLDSATAELEGQRFRQALHLSALAWAVGVALSLVLRGVVVEYRTGWESTFLGAGHVHGILTFMFTPVMALFSLAPFSLQEVESMRFDAGGGLDSSHGRRWVLLYVGLLFLFVAVPRLVLASFAWWRARRLSHRVLLNLDTAYYQDLLDKLFPVSIQFRISARSSAQRSLLLRMLSNATSVAEGATSAGLVVPTYGDVLRIECKPPEAPRPGPPAYWRQLLSRWKPRIDDEAQSEEGDVSLHVVSDASDKLELEAALALSTRAMRTLVLVCDAGDAHDALLRECALLRDTDGASVAGVVSFESFGRCWVQEPVLLQRIFQLLPHWKQRAFARVAGILLEANVARFKSSMRELANELSLDAGLRKEIAGAEASILPPSDAKRALLDRAADEAAEALTHELKLNESRATSALLEIHGLDKQAAGAGDALDWKFDRNTTVSTTQAVIGGVSTGAAAGLGVDAALGGMSLGLGAVVGGLVGATSAAMASLWKNRSSATGETELYVPDELLAKLTVEKLVGYLRVVHQRNGVAADDLLLAQWRNVVAAEVNAAREALGAIFATARMRERRDAAGLAEPLARQLESMTFRVLRTLYPAQSASSLPRELTYDGKIE